MRGDEPARRVPTEGGRSSCGLLGAFLARSSDTHACQVMGARTGEEASACRGTVLVGVVRLEAHAPAREAVERRRDHLRVVVAGVVPPEVCQRGELAVSSALEMQVRCDSRCASECKYEYTL